MRSRVVFDSNVYIAAVATPASHSMKWIRGASRENRAYDLYISEPILAEVTAKLRQKFKLSTAVITEFTNEIRAVATLVEPTEQIKVVDRDPDDDRILECAVAAEADIIITGDRDLLQLRQYRGIGIYHPSNLKYFFPLDAP